MKQYFLGLSVFAVLGASAQTKPAVKATAIKAKPVVAAASGLKTPTDSLSYALGMNIAFNLEQQGINSLNYSALQKAMEDVFKKRPQSLTEQQANQTVQMKMQEQMAKKSGAEKAKSKAFLTANGKRKEVTTLPDGLQYEVLKAGDASSEMPTPEDTVVAHYAGTLIDGKEFDNSYKRGEPLTIPVGGVIRGWTEILQKMHIGDKFKVYIPSELGYGERGAGQDIPGGAALIFEMELLGIKHPAKGAAAAEETTPPPPATKPAGQ